MNPADALKRLEALPEFTGLAGFSEARGCVQAREEHRARARRTRDARGRERRIRLEQQLKEPAEIALLQELEQRGPAIDSVLKSGENLRRAFVEAAQFGPAVDRFFTEIFVMVDDAASAKGAPAPHEAARTANLTYRRYFRNRFGDGVNSRMAKKVLTLVKKKAKPSSETEKVAKLAKPGKYVYFFGDGKADGDRTMKDLLGGKGSGLAEMTNAKLPVPGGLHHLHAGLHDLLQGRRKDSAVDRKRNDRQPAQAGEVGRPQAWRHEEAAARVGALGREVLDARHDGHDSESRPQRRDRRIA